MAFTEPNTPPPHDQQQPGEKSSPDSSGSVLSGITRQIYNGSRISNVGQHHGASPARPPSSPAAPHHPHIGAVSGSHVQVPNDSSYSKDPALNDDFKARSLPVDENSQLRLPSGRDAFSGPEDDQIHQRGGGNESSNNTPGPSQPRNNNHSSPQGPDLPTFGDDWEDGPCSEVIGHFVARIRAILSKFDTERVGNLNPELTMGRLQVNVSQTLSENRRLARQIRDKTNMSKEHEENAKEKTETLRDVFKDLTECRAQLQSLQGNHSGPDDSPRYSPVDIGHDRNNVEVRTLPRQLPLFPHATYYTTSQFHARILYISDLIAGPGVTVDDESPERNALELERLVRGQLNLVQRHERSELEALRRIQDLVNVLQGHLGINITNFEVRDDLASRMQYLERLVGTATEDKPDSSPGDDHPSGPPDKPAQRKAVVALSNCENDVARLERKTGKLEKDLAAMEKERDHEAGLRKQCVLDGGKMTKRIRDLEKNKSEGEKDKRIEELEEILSGCQEDLSKCKANSGKIDGIQRKLDETDSNYTDTLMRLSLLRQDFEALRRQHQELKDKHTSELAHSQLPRDHLQAQGTRQDQRHGNNGVTPQPLPRRPETPVAQRDVTPTPVPLNGQVPGQLTQSPSGGIIHTPPGNPPPRSVRRTLFHAAQSPSGDQSVSDVRRVRLIPVGRTPSAQSSKGPNSELQNEEDDEEEAGQESSRRHSPNKRRKL